MTYRIDENVLTEINPRVVAIHGDSKGPRTTGWPSIQTRASDAVAANVDGLMFKSGDCHRYGCIIDDGWCIVDIDTHDGQANGFDSLNDLRRDTGVDLIAEAGFIVQSPSGGKHLWFRLPEGVKLPSSHKNYPALDFLQVGKLVIGAGSVHVNGGEYEVIACDPPTMMPQEVIKLLTASVRPSGGVVAAALANAGVSDNSESPMTQFSRSRDGVEKLRELMEAEGYTFTPNQGYYSFTRPNKTDHSFKISGTLGRVNSRGNYYLRNFSTSDPHFDTESYNLAEAFRKLFCLEQSEVNAQLRGLGFGAERMDWSKGEMVKVSHENVTATVSQPAIPSPAQSRPMSRADRIRQICESKGIERSISSAEFSEREIVTEPIIDGVLIRDHSFIICGSEKTCKTTLAADLAVSLATGTPFLTRNEWTPKKQERVLVFSAESGDATLKETATRIARSKGLSLDDCGTNLRWAFWVPEFSDPESMELFDYELEAISGGVVILDPMYFMLSGDSDNNRSKFKAEFGPINDMCKKHGVTIVVVDHTNKGSVQGENKHRNNNLQDMNGNGRTAFFRSWLMIKRLSDYDRNEPHKLALQLGGSCYGVTGGSEWYLALNETPSVDQYREGIRDYLIEGILPLGEKKKQEAKNKELGESLKADSDLREVRSVIMDGLHKADGNLLTKTGVANLIWDGAPLRKKQIVQTTLDSMVKGGDIVIVDCVRDAKNIYTAISDLPPMRRQAVEKGVASGSGQGVHQLYRLKVIDPFHEPEK